MPASAATATAATAAASLVATASSTAAVIPAVASVSISVVFVCGREHAGQPHRRRYRFRHRRRRLGDLPGLFKIVDKNARSFPPSHCYIAVILRNSTKWRRGFSYINPFLFIRGLSCPRCVQVSLSLKCLKVKVSRDFFMNHLPPSSWK